MKKTEPIYQALWADTSSFSEVLISPLMIQDHMPDTVLEALQKLLNHSGPAKPQRAPPPTYLPASSFCPITNNGNNNNEPPPQPPYLETNLDSPLLRPLRTKVPLVSVEYASLPRRSSLLDDRGQLQRRVDLLNDDWLGLAPLASPETMSDVSSIGSRRSFSLPYDRPLNQITLKQPPWENGFANGRASERDGHLHPPGIYTVPAGDHEPIRYMNGENSGSDTAGEMMNTDPSLSSDIVTLDLMNLNRVRFLPDVPDLPLDSPDEKPRRVTFGPSDIVVEPVPNINCQSDSSYPLYKQLSAPSSSDTLDESARPGEYEELHPLIRPPSPFGQTQGTYL
ncbi:unnamed protein product [Darwinula stevensoni]|uniref:Uncharacterized protein n=1 Tax=Darwinula stevensoni TaxID=69355 RepID=A0A7R9A6M9_9CRUS|nr:unnamed protein product [Darwinula stevensoni]CAG0895106.1 unnamed protein product [Darwinula stevensoni]